jgi:hypothetical protein
MAIAEREQCGASPSKLWNNDGGSVDRAVLDRDEGFIDLMERKGRNLGTKTYLGCNLKEIPRV